ncbi:hypothetical protein [uncultured Aquimarina sp.]|uniref:hypothetical protein n=1 Tax=uncultured Aquimarina sp. TaxID=575652 RepID=UPI0026360B9A|nr:hypothetical protein [uncultured Aquimarina sp.]
MSQTNELNTIESEYDVSDITFNSLRVWPFLRHKIFYDIYKKKYNYSAKLRVRNKFQLIRNFFRGFYKLFMLRRYDFLFFNNADKRSLINGKYYDVFFDGIADKVGQKKSCFVEWAIHKHYNSKQSHSLNIISDLSFKLLSIIYSFFVTVDLENEEELLKIKKDYDLTFDHKKDLKRFYGEYRFYDFLFRFIRPKAIFIICNYTKVPIVTAAKNNNVLVYEAQHGFIGKNHQFYNYHGQLPKESYPDFMLTFGNEEKDNLHDHFIFKKSELIPVGSFYLDEIYKNYSDVELNGYKEKFEAVFCVTLQGVHEEELLTWVAKQARNNKNHLYILRPKYSGKSYKEIIDENIFLLPKYNIYQVLKYSDYNITIYSTTAIEAMYFDVKTIFFNIDGLSEKYFDVKKLNALVINDSDELNIEEHQISKEYNGYFIRNYLENLENLKLSI